MRETSPSRILGLRKCQESRNSESYGAKVMTRDWKLSFEGENCQASAWQHDVGDLVPTDIDRFDSPVVLGPTALAVAKQTLFVGTARSLLKISSMSVLLGAESAIFDVSSQRARHVILGRVAKAG